MNRESIMCLWFQFLSFDFIPTPSRHPVFKNIKSMLGKKSFYFCVAHSLCVKWVEGLEGNWKLLRFAPKHVPACNISLYFHRNVCCVRIPLSWKFWWRSGWGERCFRRTHTHTNLFEQMTNKKWEIFIAKVYCWVGWVLLKVG